jgi:hypothetical protein
VSRILAQNQRRSKPSTKCNPASVRPEPSINKKNIPTPYRQWISRRTRKSTTVSNIFHGARQMERLSATSFKPVRRGATANFTGASRLQMRAESSGRWSRELPRSPTCTTTNEGLSHHHQLSSERVVGLPDICNCGSAPVRLPRFPGASRSSTPLWVRERTSALVGFEDKAYGPDCKIRAWIAA